MTTRALWSSRAEEHIVDLGIVVGHPQRELSCLVQIGQGTGQVLVLQQKPDLLLSLPCAVGLVLGYGFLEVRIALAGIVETGNGLFQGVDVEVGQLLLELTEYQTGIAAGPWGPLRCCR